MNTPPRLVARIGGAAWFGTIVFGMVALILGIRYSTVAAIQAHGQVYRLGIAANVISTITYVIATIYVYELLAAVNRSVSLLAAFFSLAGCTIGCVSLAFQIAPFVATADVATSLLSLRGPISNFGFVFFGLHCFLVGSLILRSSFIPRVVGALMVFAGVSWITQGFTGIAAPVLARSIERFLVLPGLLGEGTLSLWLLLAGVKTTEVAELRWSA